MFVSNAEDKEDRDEERNDLKDEQAAKSLVPPEGYALARLKPYVVTGRLRTDAYGMDTYGMRVRWLEALSRLDDKQFVSLPPLATLIATSMAEGEAGDALRGWLEAATRRAGALTLDGVRWAFGGND